jgi:hypothetical protein
MEQCGSLRHKDIFADEGENSMKSNTAKTALAILVSVFIFFPIALSAQERKPSAGQTVYVPVYSNVFSGPQNLPFNVSAMLSIRNIDLHNPVTIVSAEYYDNDGKLLRQYIKGPQVLGPLASTHIIIKENDEEGGFGANFIVRWTAARKINTPIIESIMIGDRSGQGISFISQGRVIEEHVD